MRVGSEQAVWVWWIALFTIYAPASLAQTRVCSSQIISIPNATGSLPGTPQSVSQTIAVPGSPGASITDIDVSLDIIHTWVGDLSITITNESTGTSVTVLDRPGTPPGTYGCGRNNIDATLSDEATSAVENECAVATPTIQGNFTPNNPLNVFDGEAFNGNWTITVTDHAAEDIGALRQWCLDAATVPVMLSSFVATQGKGSIEFKWSTSTEINNVGFEIVAVDKSGAVISPQTHWLSSHAINSTQPQLYTLSIPASAADSSEHFLLSSVATNGQREHFGPFQVDIVYGEIDQPTSIDWRTIRQQHEQRRRSQIAARRTTAASGHPLQVRRTGLIGEIGVKAKGMYRLSYDDLKNRGIELAGSHPDHIAITRRGRSVARFIHTPKSRFGPGSFIDFFGYPPFGESARYTDIAVYRIHINPALARHARIRRQSKARTLRNYYRHVERYEINARYDFAIPNGDGWYAARLLARGNPAETTITMNLPESLIDSSLGAIELNAYGMADLPGAPDTNPDHHIQVFVNAMAAPVIDRRGDGVRRFDLKTRLPKGTLKPGGNRIRVVLPGDTNHEFDLVHIDAVQLTQRRQLTAIDDRLSFTIRSAQRFALVADGFNKPPLAYVATGRRELTRLITQHRGLRARVPRDREKGDVWISTRDRLLKPSRIAAARPRTRLDGPAADLLILAHPAFIPRAGDALHPLNRYLDAKQNEGYQTRLINVDDVYHRFGGGMPTPSALKDFLQNAADHFNYTHVLLVGADTYDYLNFSGAGAISFIPTLYARTAGIVHHTPADALLVDFNADSLPDKSIGRWPVRTLLELRQIVDKTLSFGRRMKKGNKSMLLIAEQDPNGGFFSASANRIKGYVDSRAPQAFTEIHSLRLDDMVSDAGASLESAIALARRKLDSLWRDGITVTVFTGHGSPSRWSYQNLLTPSLLRDFQPTRAPTLALPLACYTTYVSDPRLNSLGHELLFAPDKGAVAITGATVLSRVSDNEVMARSILTRMLNDGATLGEAIRESKRNLDGDARDVWVNWSLLGDPTLRLN